MAVVAVMSACGESPLGERDGGAGEAPPLVSDPGWSQSEVQPCLDPRAVEWVDRSDRMSELPHPEGGELEGSLTLSKIDGVWWITTLFGPRQTVTWPLDGDPRRWTWQEPPLRLALLDLEGTGAVDLLVLGESVRAVPGWVGSADAVRDLFVGEFGVRFVDASLADLDGDGGAELVLGQSGLPGGNGPAVATRAAGGSWGDAVSLGTGATGEPFDILVLDFDEDGVPDAYMCHHRGPELGPNTLWRGMARAGWWKRPLPAPPSAAPA